MREESNKNGNQMICKNNCVYTATRKEKAEENETKRNETKRNETKRNEKLCLQCCVFH